MRMMAKRRTPSFRNLGPASPAARRASQGSSKKSDTRCELVLRRALWASGLRYRVAAVHLIGKPDVIFRRRRVAVFCDGDFWHGRNLKKRLRCLSRGHNASYWVEKIRTNVERDVTNTERLRNAGWVVVRLWETDILRDPTAAVAQVQRALESSDGPRSLRGTDPVKKLR
jgi:DNA mismatch endonuclease, patch repair protein